jgi:hypothetical protein
MFPENAIQNTLAVTAPSERTFMLILPEWLRGARYLATILTEVLSDMSSMAAVQSGVASVLNIQRLSLALTYQTTFRKC